MKTLASRPCSLLFVLALAACGGGGGGAAPAASPGEAPAGKPPGQSAPPDGSPGALAAKRPGEPAEIQAKGGGGTESKGRLAPEQIQRTVKQRMPAFKTCYEAGLKKNAALKGRLVLKFEIDTEGAAKRATATESSLGDDDVVSCILDELRKTPFPKPEGGSVTVAYPMEFAP
jgi:hypothetical protein